MISQYICKKKKLYICECLKVNHFAVHSLSHKVNSTISQQNEILLFPNHLYWITSIIERFIISQSTAELFVGPGPKDNMNKLLILQVTRRWLALYGLKAPSGSCVSYPRSSVLSDLISFRWSPTDKTCPGEYKMLSEN